MSPSSKVGCRFLLLHNSPPVTRKDHLSHPGKKPLDDEYGELVLDTCSLEIRDPKHFFFRLNHFGEATVPVEVQVQEAVDAIDNTITTARTERDIALKVAQNETRKRIEAENELKRLQEEHRSRKNVDRIQAMMSATRAMELDSIFEELDKAVGVDLDFDLNIDQNLDQEKILKAGRAYVESIGNTFQGMGDMSQLPDVDFVNTRYRYLME